MARQVVELLADPAELERQRGLARARAVGEYSAEKVVPRYEELYLRLVTS